jgi:hypothetical protein
MKKLLFTLALFVGMKSFAQVNAHDVAEIVVKIDNDKFSFIHKEEYDWEMQLLDDKDATKLKTKELEEITDHTFILEIKDLGMRIKFDLTTKKAMVYEMDDDTKKYSETSKITGDILSFK